MLVRVEFGKAFTGFKIGKVVREQDQAETQVLGQLLQLVVEEEDLLQPLYVMVAEEIHNAGLIVLLAVPEALGAELALITVGIPQVVQVQGVKEITVEQVQKELRLQLVLEVGVAAAQHNPLNQMTMVSLIGLVEMEGTGYVQKFPVANRVMVEEARATTVRHTETHFQLDVVGFVLCRPREVEEVSTSHRWA
jgi:hypothetical protein